MKFLALFLIIVYLSHIKIESLNLKVVNEVPSRLLPINHTKEVLTCDDEIKDQLKSFENKLKDDKFFINLKKKGVDLSEIQSILKKYAEIKSKAKYKDKSSLGGKNVINKINKVIKPENSLRFKEQHIKDDNLSNKLFEKNYDKDLMSEESKMNNILRIQPLNVIVNQPEKIIGDNKNKIDILKIINYQYEKNQINNIQIENCNNGWDYFLHGDDWNCICQCGSYQSPIDIRSLENKIKSSVKGTPPSIFFDFKNSELSCSNADENVCKFPIIKNTRNELVIEDDCGYLVMPPHMNGYECYKIEFHSPGEHKIDSKQFELEIQIYFKMEDKRIVDNETRDYIVLSILVKGLDEENSSNDFSNTRKITNHPFLELLEINKLPSIKGQARLLSKFLNFDFLFDDSKQPDKLSTSEEVNFIESSSSLVRMAFNELTYDRNYPLKEYYLYNGSFTKPPCYENVQFIIVPKPILAPMTQIIKISKVILESGNKQGNNRNTQPINGRPIFHYKNKEKLIDSIRDLKLFNSKNERDATKDNLVQNDKTDSDQFLDKIFESEQGNLNNILSFAKLR